MLATWARLRSGKALKANVVERSQVFENHPALDDPNLELTVTDTYQLPIYTYLS